MNDDRFLGLEPAYKRYEATNNDLWTELEGIRKEVGSLVELTEEGLRQAKARHETLKRISLALALIIGLTVAMALF